jgi:sugar lactone lactonase YvrE
MTKLTGLWPLLACLFLHACASLIPFEARDFTAENLFSENIEGPCFDRNGQLYVVNYQHDGTIGKVNADGSCELFVELPGGSIANSIQFDSKGDMLLADFPKHNVLKVNMQTREVSVFCHDERFHQPNDLCVSSRDQIFASDPNWNKSTGQLWRIDPDGRATLLESGMGTTNGICLSPDEKHLYVNESIQRKVWRYDLDAEGRISNKKLLHEFPDFGTDGMKCDKKGKLYVTRWGKGVIAILSPEGKLLNEVQLKGKKCSNLTFGGKNNKTVFVTLQDRKGIEVFRSRTGGK